MRMKLKNNSKKLNLKKLNKYFNTRSFFIFISSLFIVSIVFGIIYFTLLKPSYKESIYTNLDKVYNFNNYKYFNIFKQNIISNTFNTIIIWILGISVIGILFLLFILFSEAFSLGLFMASAIAKYNLKGIILIFCYIFSGRIIYLLLIIFLIYKSSLFSYKLIKFLFLKKDIDIKKEFKKYFKTLIFSCLVALIYSIIITFISPFIYKLFTFFLK